MRIHRLVFGSVALLAFLRTSSVVAQEQPAIRPIGAFMRVSAPGALGSVTSVRQLSDRQVLVNDIVRRQLLLLDSTMTIAVVVVDSARNAGGTLGAQVGGIIPYRSDSTLFVDPASLSMLVIDPRGRIARVIAAPRPQDIGYLVGGPFGTPVIDARGRLIYRGAARPVAKASKPDVTDFPFTLPVAPDSSPVVRMDLVTRMLDTLAMYKVLRSDTKVARDEAGKLSISTTLNPMQAVDDWAVLSDGTLAAVRGSDYHVEWIDADGKTSSVTKIPFAWHRLTDGDRQAVLDSARLEVDKSLAAARARFSSGMATAPDAGAVSPRRGSAVSAPTINLVGPADLPDYRPAFAPGAARGDRAGRLWIRTSQSVDGGAVYDVVNRSGGLIDRVKLPPRRVIAGFGDDDTVFLGVLDAVGARIEQVRFR